MGFLHESVPLQWNEAMDKLQYVREHGLDQFVNIFKLAKSIQGDPLRWGDEIEHGVFRLVGSPTDDQRSVQVSLRSPEIIQELKDSEQPGLAHETCTWMPEYGRWMLESTPGGPFEGLNDILKLEQSMRLRRSKLVSALKPGEIAPTVSCMPLFGTSNFCHPSQTPNGPIAESLFVPDDLIFPHPRFHTLTKNIRERRQSKVEIRRPLMIDEQTQKPKYTDLSFVPKTVEEADSMNHVYADAMAFGMGSCCLQVTMQASDLTESRLLYDQLAVLTPIFMALTAATPFLRGWICDDDCRWETISQSVDDRTEQERGKRQGGGDAKLAGNGTRFLPKSRYDSIDCYIGNDQEIDKQASLYNDCLLVSDPAHVKKLVENGVDEVLANHIAHLFARDPLVIFNDRLELDDGKDIDHWENLQSTNWQTMRWKPPSPEKASFDKHSEQHIGWRVEFRSMELQMTDFENAAFTSFVMLLSRVILGLKLNLYIPMSKLEENMQEAGQRDACTKERFWFRTDVVSDEGKEASHPPQPYELMSIAEILGGKEGFPGLIPICETYLDSAGYDSETNALLKKYMTFIMGRAQGKTRTTAAWMRSFVMEHPSYKKDSRVPAAAAFDLMAMATKIGMGTQSCPEVLGDIQIPMVDAPGVSSFTKKSV